MPILIAIISVIFIVFLYVGTMVLNNRTPIPQGCEQAYMEAQECESCSSNGSASCSIGDPKFIDAIEFMKEVKL